MIPEPIHRPAPPRTKGRTRFVVTALGTMALLAAVALLSRGFGKDSGQPKTRQAPELARLARFAPSGTDETDRQGKTADDKASRFDDTTCWDDIENFNEKVTLENFREWAAPLWASKDPLVIEYLKQRLGELIGDDEGRAGQVLGWARSASPAEFKLLMGGLRSSKALPKMAAQLTSLGLDKSLDLGRRAGFLDELQHLPRLEPEALDKLTHLAEDASSGEAGWVTTRAIGRVMKADLTRTGTFEPYLDKLLTIGANSKDEQVRYLALEMELHAEAPLDAKALDRLEKILTTDGSDHVRQVVAHDLSLSEDKPRALDIYAKAFQQETDLCARWAFFRFAARVAGKDALPIMANMAQGDPRFQGIYQEFDRLYASGIVDFGRLWLSLPSDNPFGCLDHHDDP
ncbi:MAG TPA: hypothetical protein VH877_17760 [Polyangia bacterium]|nr:hypothetical protein [Polyangia bacterium]